MENSTPQKNNRTVMILLAVIVVLLAAVLGMFVLKNDAGEDAGPTLGYATEGITEVRNANALQEAVNAAYEKSKNSISLSYQRTARSNDGQNFKCYIGNSDINDYDMYIGIYADQEFQEQLFLSGLIRPGEAFEKITLDRKLNSGSHEVYVVYTQVEEDMQTAHGQTVVKMEFVVE